MTYKQTLAYMYSQLPMFHRIGSAAYKANLDNTIAICKLLGNPENKFKSVHVAGTNGKGSTSHMLAAVLQSGGYKTGLYTSPHLKDFRERIRVNGKMISKDFITEFVSTHKNAFEKIQPSFFEMTVGLAFDYFAKQKVDIAIIEVGLGGRLDSTNVISPLLSVITNISFDHQNLLGDTLEKIAREKAGIIKSNTPVVINETQDGISKLFFYKAKELNAPIYFADEFYKAKNVRHKTMNGKLKLICDLKKKKNIVCELPGLYQQKNIAGILKSCDILNETGFKITEDNLRDGIAHVSTLTGLLGRWQILGNKPLIVADTGHNEAGIKEVLKQIKSTPHKQLHFVLGMVNDKDISKILKLLPKKANYYFCKAKIPRALDEHVLASHAIAMGLQGNIYGSVKKALSAAKKIAKKNDLIFIGGSTFVVAEAI